MNNFLKCSGVFCLIFFSFFYTEKVVDMVNKSDPVMKEIKNYSSSNNSDCIEGTVTDDGVVLGVNGKEINVSKSYSNMRGIGFNEEVLEYSEEECNVTKEKYMDHYIIGGNKVKNAVSIMIHVKDASMINKISQISKNKNIRVTFVVSGSVLETNIDLFKELYKDGFGIVYNGVDELDLKKYLLLMREINKKNDPYCVYSKINDIKNICSKNKINSIKTKYMFNKNILINTKKTLDKGVFFMYDEDEFTVSELSITINFIKAKGYKLVTINDHLSNDI